MIDVKAWSIVPGCPGVLNSYTVFNKEKKGWFHKMKNRLSHVFFLAVLVMLLSCTAIPTAAASFKRVSSSTVVPVSERTVNGASFWAKNYKSSGFDLYVIKSGKKYLISTKLDDQALITNGSTVYYVAKMAKGKYLYRYTISNKKKTQIAKLASAKQHVELSGYYDSHIFFIFDSPEGAFHCVNVEDGDVEMLVSNPNYGVSSVEQCGKHFILSDGAEEGHSYVGVYDAVDFNFTDLWSSPARWYATSNNIYCAVIREGFLPITADRPVIVSVEKYNYKTRLYTVFSTYIAVTEIISISDQKMVYRDQNGKRKVFSW
jgi:hypothetical protein